MIAVLTARGFSSHRLPARFNDRLDFDLDLLGKHVDHILVDATKLAALRVLVASAPSIVNQFTVIVKSSTLVSVITVPDLMSESQRLVNVWYEPIEILTATAAIYILFVFLISLAGKLLADHLRRRYGLAAT